MTSFTPESAISLIILRLWVSGIIKVEEEWNYYLQVLFLSACEIEHFLSILQQNCSLRLCLGYIQRTCEDADFGPGELLNHS